MNTNFMKSTVGLLNFIFRSNKTKKEPKVENNNDLVQQKEKIIFQPNVLQTKNHIEFPSSKKPSEENQSEYEEDKISHKIALELNYSAMCHLESLCRYFEVNQLDFLARGIWILSIIRDVEINNKKIGIISVDENGLVSDITPIDIV